jgi:RND family efflux transporter MFP subunit
MRKKRLIILAVVIILASVMLVSCMGRKKEEPVKEEYAYQAISVITEGVVSDEVYHSIYTIGEVEASEQYQANAVVSGDVLEIFFNTGDYVEEGQVLFTIETTDFEVDKSTSLTQSSNGVTQAKIAYDAAKENYEKYQTLFESGAASQSQLDGIKDGFENARIAYNNALKSYESVKHNYESMGDNYAITAPISGVITNKNVKVGMFATAQNGFTIDVTKQYIVSSQIASKYINDIEEGQEVEIYVSTLDQLVSGSIDSISLSAQNGSYPIEIALETGNTLLKPGMYADVWILKDKTSEGLWIPSQALIQESGVSFVYTVDDDVAKKVEVDVLTMRGEDIAIKSNLTKDQRLITFGKEYVMDGAPVIVK